MERGNIDVEKLAFLQHLQLQGSRKPAFLLEAIGVGRLGRSLGLASNSLWQNGHRFFHLRQERNGLRIVCAGLSRIVCTVRLASRRRDFNEIFPSPPKFPNHHALVARKAVLSTFSENPGFRVILAKEVPDLQKFYFGPVFPPPPPNRRYSSNVLTS